MTFKKFAVESCEQCNQSEMAGLHDRNFDDQSRWYLQFATQTARELEPFFRLARQPAGAMSAPNYWLDTRFQLWHRASSPCLVSQPSA
jgi:hypothetical protein